MKFFKVVPVLFLLVFYCSSFVYAEDSLKVLTIQDFLQLVLKNHPVAKQAELLPERAKREIRMARGNFDPAIYSKSNEKMFKDKSYYHHWDNYMKVPTWFGIDLKAGFEKNAGYYLNPENYTGKEGLSYVGISVPIGQGLLIDERRSVLRQAQLLPQMAEAERVKVINKLVLQATKDYWDWMLNYRKWDLQKQAYQLNTIRFSGIKNRVLQGDLSVIDSVEAKMQLLNLGVQMSQSELDYRNASLILSNHLWGEDEIPLEITKNLIPSEVGTENVNIPADSVANLINSAKTNHPDIIKSTVKLNQLSIERRFLADKFKPKLNFEYNILQSNYTFQTSNFNPDYFTHNYKYGLSFSFPLFLRAERGKYQLNGLKMQEINFELLLINREIENNIQAVSNDLANLQRQLEMQEQLVQSTGQLLRGEQEKFSNGESSIFLINSRENSYISSQVKLIEMRAKYAKAKSTLYWASGSNYSY